MRQFGTIRKLPSGRFQAVCAMPDGSRRIGPRTWSQEWEAEGWLVEVRAAIRDNTWQSDVDADVAAKREERATPPTLREFAESWLARRAVIGSGRNSEPLKPRTVALYRNQLDRLILPALGDHPLTDRGLTRADVRDWFEALPVRNRTQNVATFGLLRAICNDAVERERLTANPCRARDAGTAPDRKRAYHIIEHKDRDQITAMAAKLPARMRLLPEIGFWLGLRWGEATELRRKDIDLDAGVIRVRRAVSWIRNVGQPGNFHVGTPKTKAGIRDLAIPPHLIPAIEAHLAEHVRFGGPDALIFRGQDGPTAHVRQPSFSRPWARIVAETPATGTADGTHAGLTFHDLRHSHGTMYMQMGASIKETMARLGHSDPKMTLRYSHATSARDRDMADRLSGGSEATTRRADTPRGGSAIG